MRPEKESRWRSTALEIGLGYPGLGSSFIVGLLAARTLADPNLVVIGARHYAAFEYWLGTCPVGTGLMTSFVAVPTLPIFPFPYGVAVVPDH